MEARGESGLRSAFLGRNSLLLTLLVLVGTACWEQVAPEWFAQMKRQPAMQAFEGVEPLMPPVGTIPFGGIEARIDHPAPAFTPEAMALPNPIPTSEVSIARGKEVYTVYCSICHGVDGMAKAEQNPVAKFMAEGGMPPLPLVAVPAYTDGFIFTKIRYGKPGMPGYPQIPPEDRWHVVNYLRVLMPKLPTPVAAPAAGG
jgi:mono/diheme cytochrome c family protein